MVRIGFNIYQYSNDENCTLYLFIDFISYPFFLCAKS